MKSRVALLFLAALGTTACGVVEPSGLRSPDAARDGSAHAEAGARGDATVGEAGDAKHDARTVTYDSSCGKDLQTDPGNCGACGHDCLGGACTAGRCQPVVLVTVPQPGISSFAVDGTSVYWTSQFTYTDSGLVIYNSGTVSKCSLEGCTSPTVLASGQKYPDAIWVGGPDLYWNNLNGFATMHCGTSCTDDATTYFAWEDGSESFFGWGESPDLAIGATSVFVSTAGGILECARDACPTPTVFVTQPNPVEVALTDAGVYWVNLGEEVGGKSPGYIDGGVNGCPRTGCPDATPTSLANHLSYGHGLVVQGGKAYWLEDSLFSCDVKGCDDAPTTVLASPELGPEIQEVAADTKDLYLGVAPDEPEGPDAGWQLERCPLAGCPDGATPLASTPLARTADYGGPVVVDVTRVYFVSGDRTRILALAK